MMEQKTGTLINECKQIAEDSMYTAEAHYLMGAKLERRAFWFEFIPICVTVGAAFTLLLGAPDWVAWITLFSGLVTMAGVLKDFSKKSRDHLSAAQDFTVLKHEARSLQEVFHNFMGEGDLLHEVKRLREKYNLLAKKTLPTDDEEAWKLARENIKSGRHQADFREHS